MPWWDWPPPLRNGKHPEGRPEALRTAPWFAERVANASEMANLAAEQCIKAVEEGRYFTLENPGQSWMWQLPRLKRLASLPGVQWLTFHSCAF